MLLFDLQAVLLSWCKSERLSVRFCIKSGRISIRRGIQREQRDATRVVSSLQHRSVYLRYVYPQLVVHSSRIINNSLNSLKGVSEPLLTPMLRMG